MKFGWDQVKEDTPRSVQIKLYISVIVLSIIDMWVSRTSLVSDVFKDETNIIISIADISLIAISQLFGKGTEKPKQ